MTASLDHVNIETNDLEATIEFYESVLGLQARAKPSGKPGVWLHAGDQAVVHVGIIESEPTANTGALNHVAFSAIDLEAVVSKLESAGIDYAISERPDIGLSQLRVSDPNGIPIELNFALGS